MYIDHSDVGSAIGTSSAHNALTYCTTTIDWEIFIVHNFCHYPTMMKIFNIEYQTMKLHILCAEVTK